MSHLQAMVLALLLVIGFDVAVALVLPSYLFPFVTLPFAGWVGWQASEAVGQ